MANGFRSLVILSVFCQLAGCGARTGGGSALPPSDAVTPGAAGTPAAAVVATGPATEVAGKSPVQLYSEIARLVRACWLNARKPVLRGHVFRGEAGAGGKSGTATNIVIYQQTSDNKLGLRAFRIDFVPNRKGTQVVAQNLKLPEPQGQQFVLTVGYWAQGGTNCSP